MSILFVSDLDGTLLQPDARLSDTTVHLLNRAISQGGLFTVATARTPATVAPILSNVKMNLPAIVMTGAALWDSSTGKYSRKILITPEAAEKLLDIYRTTDTPTFVYSLRDDMIYIRHIGALEGVQLDFLKEREHNPFKRVMTDETGFSEFPETMDDMILLYAMLSNEKALETYHLTRNLAGIRAQYYHDIYGEQTAILEAFSSEATKAKAMRALAENRGADRIVAFGDNINDLPMMEEADLAVAVANARDEVKEAADIVIGPNTDNSVARFILEAAENPGVLSFPK